MVHVVGIPTVPLGGTKFDKDFFSSVHIEQHTDGKRSASGFQRCVIRAAELIQTTSYGTQIAAAVREICAVLILVYCINQIHIHCNIYEFV